MSLSTEGKDLKVGDTIVCWWGHDTITKIEPYTGPLSHLWADHGGARVASFARNLCGMTIEPQITFDVVGRRA